MTKSRRVSPVIALLSHDTIKRASGGPKRAVLQPSSGPKAFRSSARFPVIRNRPFETIDFAGPLAFDTLLQFPNPQFRTPWQDAPFDVGRPIRCHFARPGLDQTPAAALPILY